MSRSIINLRSTADSGNQVISNFYTSPISNIRFHTHENSEFSKIIDLHDAVGEEESHSSEWK